MKLCVDFDDDLIERYVKRGSSPLFTIYWKQDDAAYPEEQWLDFGLVIVGWWLVAAKSLLNGTGETELLFMDGPYRLKAHRVGNLIQFTAENEAWVWRIPIDTFIAELLRAADKIQQKFVELGISGTEGLQAGVHSLRLLAMSQAKPKGVRNFPLERERVS